MKGFPLPGSSQDPVSPSHGSLSDAASKGICEILRSFGFPADEHTEAVIASQTTITKLVSEMPLLSAGIEIFRLLRAREGVGAPTAEEQKWNGLETTPSPPPSLGLPHSSSQVPEADESAARQQPDSAVSAPPPAGPTTGPTAAATADE